MAAVASAHAATPRIVAATWLGGEELTLQFDTPMQTFEGDAELRIAFDPAFPCTWHWSGSTELECAKTRNSDGAAGATRYSISIDQPLRSQQGEPLAPQTVTADTELPRLSASIEDWQARQTQVTVESNFPVSAASLRTHLQIAIDGIPTADYSLDELAPPRVYSSGERTQPQRWLMTLLAPPATDSILSLRVKPGLPSSEGRSPGVQDEILLQARLNEPFRLREVARDPESAEADQPDQAGTHLPLLNCRAGDDLLLRFSDPLAPAALAAIKTRLPRGIELIDNPRPDHRGVEPHLCTAPRAQSVGDIEQRPGADVRFRLTAPHAPFTLWLPAVTSARTGKKIAAGPLLQMAIGDYRPTTSVQPLQMVLPLQTPLPKIITSVNETRLTLYNDELLDGAARSTTRALATGARNILTTQQPAGASPDLWRTGGLLQGNINGRNAADEVTSSAEYFLSYAAFNVTVSETDAQMLVWASDWAGAAPIDNALIEILRSHPDDTLTLVALGHTDRSGIARIDLAPDAFNGHGHFIVRATHNGQRAVLPLAFPTDRAKAPTYANARYFGSGDELSWGIVDRPLYRPGDRVNYRIWLRQRQQDRHITLRAPMAGVRFWLIALDHTPIAEAFVAMPDLYGSVSGDLSLPSRMNDGDYCIEGDESAYQHNEPVCFRVSNGPVNTRRVEIHTDRQLAFEGENIAFAVHTVDGSGAPVAGVPLALNSLLMPLPIDQAYPAFAEYRFVDPFEGTAGARGEAFPLDAASGTRSDASGHADISLGLTDPGQPRAPYGVRHAPIPFGRLQVIASTPTKGITDISSPPVALLYSRYRRFVGLKISPSQNTADSELQIDAIVASAQGESVDTARIIVGIEEVAADERLTSSRALAHCDFPLDQGRACMFKPAHSALYRFRATSGDAAPVMLEHYAWVGTQPIQITHATRLALHAPTLPLVKGGTAELVLQQPFARSKAWISIIGPYGTIKSWVEAFTGNVVPLRIPVEPDWPPQIRVSVTLLDTTLPAFAANAPTRPLLEQIDTQLQLEVAAAPTPVAVQVDQDHARPGDDVAIRLHNRTARSLQLTVAVVDDALGAQAPDIVAKSDPAVIDWLGHNDAAVDPTWYGLGTWARSVKDHNEENSPYSVFSFFRTDADITPITGSDFTAVDAFHPGIAIDPSLVLPASPSDRSSPRPPATAAWLPDIELAAHASQTLHLRLPTDAARWRVRVWSADQTNGFALAQTTIETRH